MLSNKTIQVYRSMMSRSIVYDNRKNPKPIIKRAFGVACVRYNSEMREYEILMVRKRCTYAFHSFVAGKYDRGDERSMMNLFNAMTNQEKLDILSLDFDILWWRIWLTRAHDYASSHNIPLNDNITDSNDWTDIYKTRSLWNVISSKQSQSRQKMYIKNKARFSETFLIDNGARLARLIKASNISRNLMWDIPRGQKNGCESDLGCAVREFGEETGVKPCDYRILYEHPPVSYSYTDVGITYVDTFYIAVATKKILPRVSFKTPFQIVEIDNIAWMGITELRYLSCKRDLPGILTMIFKVAKKRYKSSKAQPQLQVYSYWEDNEQRQLENCH